MNTDYLTLCLVTNAQDIPFAEYKKLIIHAIEGGVTAIQLREKSKHITQLYHMALELKALLIPFKIPLIINDHVDLAKAVNAEGVHLGQMDDDPHAARKKLGPDKIIGLSIETLDELNLANHLNCINYVAASAVFPSTTKTNCKTIWGLEGLQTFAKTAKHPVVAIGGINQQNIKQVIHHGAHGAAVISAIHAQKNPKNAAIALMAEINSSGVKHA